MIKAGYFQFRPLFGKPQKNLLKILRTLETVEADLIVLPELPFSGYHFQSREEAMALGEDPQSSPTIDSLVNLCRARNFRLVTGFAEKQKDKLFNSALLLGPGGIEATYRKLHLFNTEKFWFDPGDLPLETHQVGDCNIGMMVCFDWVFPEVMRSLSIMGADIICHPSNLVLSYCQTTMLSRCIENGVFAITANRFGADVRPHGRLRFTGKSQIVAPKGILLNRAASQRNQLHIAELDMDLARDKQMTENNDLFADRRPEYYLRLIDDSMA